ncbi:MAG: CAP domain-containing protein [Rhizobiales bacterium]|nr:CAP domain-containing protein [Hyphomicrobiales bacterium]
MFRVAVALLLTVLLAACSTGLNPGSLGFAGGGGSSASDDDASDGGGGLFGFFSSGKSRDADETRVAARDAAPQGSWKRAPRGALADRSYTDTRLDAEEALALINGYRKAHGLGPLKLHPQLVRAAKDHSADLARFDRISHYGSDGSNPWDRIRRTGYPARVAAENVGTGQATIAEVFEGWKESEAHNRNLLLKDAHHAGIALVRDERTEFKTFWTLVLGATL